MQRLLPLLSLLLLCTCDRAQTAETTSADRPPNIIFILTDDQGYGDIAAHGNPWLQTPNLDALHDQSVRFTNFHVATTCAPTRSGLMSGVNCNRAGAWHTIGGRSMLSTRFVTLADELKEEGYTTGIFGKWHLGDNYPFRPQDRGFDEVLIHGGGGVGQTPDAWNNDYFDDTYFHNGTPKKYAGYCTDVWFREGMKFIEEKAAEDRPFFAYIATNAPHGPYHIEEKYVTPYRNNPDIPNPRFFGMIANLDDNLGQLMALLDSSGLAENTLLVYMTDNGTSSGAAPGKGQHIKKGFNAQMRGTKGSEYDGGHRVPFFLRFPLANGIRPAAYDQLTSYTDFLPTMIDYVGGELELNYALEGQSLMPLLISGEQPELRGRYMTVDTQREDLPVRGKRSCVMEGDWRLIKGEELYNLAEDPGQQNDLAGQFPDRVAAMQTAYDAWWEGMAEDLKVTHRIIVGHPAEPKTLLTAHDWHTNAPPPWNQNHIRAGLVDNGWWALDIAKAGTYSMKLYRYPPESGLSLTAVAPAGDDIPNGTAYLPGEILQPVSARYQVGEQSVSAQVADGAPYVAFDVELAAGHQELQTWVADAAGQERGAYYVTLERME